MELSRTLLDKIKQEIENIQYGKMVLYISPKDIKIDVITRMSVNKDDYTASAASPR